MSFSFLMQIKYESRPLLFNADGRRSIKRHHCRWFGVWNLDITSQQRRHLVTDLVPDCLAIFLRHIHS